MATNPECLLKIAELNNGGSKIDINFDDRQSLMSMATLPSGDEGINILKCKVDGCNAICTVVMGSLIEFEDFDNQESCPVIAGDINKND